MINRPLYTRKYHSARLKEFGYAVTNTFEESKKLNEIVALSDSQMQKTIRDVKRRTIDREKLEVLIKTRDYYLEKNTYRQSKKGSRTAKRIAQKFIALQAKNRLPEQMERRMYEKYIDISVNRDEARRIQDKINRTLFNPDYITVVMDTVKQYEYLFQNGFTVNGERFRRFSCGAGQARVSTVVFVNEKLIPKVRERLNNGRDMDKKLSPSKFNAYFGLYGSSTLPVSEPNFIVVKDYVNTASFMANFVTENGWNVDDTVTQKEIKDMKMNRTDGMGLISYRQAAKWADELGLDYIPSQFCIRQSFIKGMLCVFPIHEFCKDKNNGNYLVDTIYRDENGSYIKADLRDYDVILTESQFKLWDSYDSLETYIANCRKNKLDWRISLVTPKEPKNILKLNYQFIQTLNLNKEDVKALAAQFVDWITNVSYDDAYYMMLFLLGTNNDAEKINRFLSGDDAYWLKALVADHSVKNDAYIRAKIRERIRRKIENGCKGDIYVNGNFQVIVSDPYGFMQHVCGLPVTGLLKKGKSYSNYWNERGVSYVDAMRAPLTYLSEHVILDLQKDEETEKWYRYCRQGIILNYHGHETVNFAGSDFDFDILATTNNPVMIKGVYRDELPVVYNAPKPKKIRLTEEDLYLSDTFSFGSVIGSITNKSSSAYAKLPIVEQQFGTDSQEYRLMKSRLQQCCKAQSAQIDKAKIGQEVKAVPKVWVQRNAVRKDRHGNARGRRLAQKILYNNTLLDKYPYFFRYIYQETDKAYKKYLDEYNVICRQKYRCPFHELETVPNKTPEQQELIRRFYEYCPVVISDSPMNLLCRYIEDIDFHIVQKTKNSDTGFSYELYKQPELEYAPFYEDVKQSLQQFMAAKRNLLVTEQTARTADEFCYDAASETLKDTLAKVNANPYVIVNCLVDYFYQEKPKANKELLWEAYGKYIYKNIAKNRQRATALFPMPCRENETCDLEYLGGNYHLREVRL